MSAERTPRERRLRAQAADARARADGLAMRYVERTAVEREAATIRAIGEAWLDRIPGEVARRVVAVDAAEALAQLTDVVIDVRRGFAADVGTGRASGRRPRKTR
jgi:hypothetical protein